MILLLSIAGIKESSLYNIKFENGTSFIETKANEAYESTIWTSNRHKQLLTSNMSSTISNNSNDDSRINDASLSTEENVAYGCTRIDEVDLAGNVQGELLEDDNDVEYTYVKFHGQLTVI